MLVLNEKTLVETVDLEELIGRMEQTMLFADEGNFAMPLRSSVSLNGGDSLMLMPCVTPDAWGCKLLTLRPGNPQKGLPFINGAVMLFDANTGDPKALLEGKMVTALRTGAVGGAGIKNTARADIGSLGLVGTGAQGFWQAQFGCAARKGVKEVWIYDALTEKLAPFAEKLRAALPGVTVKIAASAAELLEKTEVVMTATPSRSPLFPDDEKLLAGHAFTGIGSYLPEMREYPDALFRLTGGDVYVDTPHALDETGDLITPLENGALRRENIHTLAELIGGKRKTESDTTFFKSVGMALFDIAAADYLCEKAAQKGLGQKVEF